MGISADDIIDGLAERIAAKVAELIGGAAPAAEPPPEATPAETADQPGATPKRRGRPPKQEAPAEPPPPAAEPPAGDAPTEAQKQYITDNYDLAAVELQTVKDDLRTYYIACNCDEAEVDKMLAETEEPVLRDDYSEYMARLVSEAGGKFAFLTDYTTPYPATRVAADGNEAVLWIKGGVTMTEEEGEGLGDAAEATQAPRPKPVPKPAPKAAPKPAPKKTTPAKK
jgi:hypothetical protein